MVRIILWPPSSPAPSLLSSASARKPTKTQRLGAAVFVRERLTHLQICGTNGAFLWRPCRSTKTSIPTASYRIKPMNAQLPIRDASRQRADESERFFRQHLPREWICDPVASDYGIDLRVAVVDGM